MEILSLAFAGKVLMVALKPVLPKDLIWLLRAIIPQQKLQIANELEEERRLIRPELCHVFQLQFGCVDMAIDLLYSTPDLFI